MKKLMLLIIIILPTLLLVQHSFSGVVNIDFESDVDDETYVLPGIAEQDYVLFNGLVPFDTGGGVYGIQVNSLDGLITGFQVSADIPVFPKPVYDIQMSQLIDKNFSGIVYRDGLLKVSIEKQKFKDIMNEIAIKAGIEILISYPADEMMTESFDYLPLKEGLRQLLRDKNYAFKYKTVEVNHSQNNTNLIEVFIFSKFEDKVVAKSERLEKNGDTSNIGQTLAINEIQNQIREKLDEILVLQNLSQSGENVEKQFRLAMDDLKKTGIFEEKTKFKNGAGIEEQIKNALQKIQGKEK